MQLRIALQSMTGSLINKLDQFVIFCTIDKTEIEMTFQRSKKVTTCGMQLTSNLGTGIAWDNFGLFVDTDSGKDTLHDTHVNFEITLKI